MQGQVHGRRPSDFEIVGGRMHEKRSQALVRRMRRWPERFIADDQTGHTTHDLRLRHKVHTS